MNNKTEFAFLLREHSLKKDEQIIENHLSICVVNIYMLYFQKNNLMVLLMIIESSQ